MYPVIALLSSLALLADWRSVESMLAVLPPKAKTVAHWRRADAAFLAASTDGKRVQSVVRLDGGRTEIHYPGELGRIRGRSLTSLDLEGVQTARTVVLFHTEPHLASSALSFDTGRDNAASLQFIVTGIAPGMWEVWRDGWVVDIGVPVRAGEAVLWFEGRPGSYFIRRLQ